ncbi:hypothetical protein WI38_22900 [Burkholderia ubonensis]|uniref:Uncharacterized protein n=1 Tax=Burkholderia ubonensis TaxID=101571 RepID=A0A124L0T4_9BURK|nr:hypothetical protein [Burkholderia ubonensis]KUZ59908.1 hypothetical protein WI35_32270 [Burkholderia ubonensis]KUZ86708.1 hypothetical protein WI38_22900 [Burkholderia ubonensis]KUZ96378.1 hypothetical protein WI39_12190 [Burkholderia ubonensis]
MVVQRLSILAAFGKLQAASIWRCLANRGAKVRRVRIDVDLNTGIESMNVDIVESGLLRTADIAAALGEVPLHMTLTTFHLGLVSNPEATVSRPIARPAPRLTVVRDISRHMARIKRD